MSRQVCPPCGFKWRSVWEGHFSISLCLSWWWKVFALVHVPCETRRLSALVRSVFGSELTWNQWVILSHGSGWEPCNKTTRQVQSHDCASESHPNTLKPGVDLLNLYLKMYFWSYQDRFCWELQIRDFTAQRRNGDRSCWVRGDPSLNCNVGLVWQ